MSSSWSNLPLTVHLVLCILRAEQSPSSRIVLTYHRPRLIPDILARWFSGCGPRKYLVNVYNWHAGSYGLCSSRSVAGNKAVLEANLHMHAPVCTRAYRSVRLTLSHKAVGSSQSFEQFYKVMTNILAYILRICPSVHPFSTALHRGNTRVK